MRVSDYEIYQKMNSFGFSVVQVDERFVLCAFDQEIRELLGSNLQIPVDEMGYDEENRQDLHAFVTELREGREGRIVAIIADRGNRPHLMDLWGRRISEDPVRYELKIWDISNMESDITYFRDCMWKYRAMIGLSSLIFMDYNLVENNVSIYRYVTKKSVRVFYGTREEFEAGCRKYAEPSEHNMEMIDQILKKIREGQNFVEGTICTGLLQQDHKPQKLHLRAKYDDMYGHHMMYGVISNMSETEEDLPYYLTSAGLDSMTGLLSKRSLIEYTENIFSNPATAGRKHYMILLDMDDFKRINDNYGHRVGDQAILLLSRTLSDVVKEDGIIGRYGGDEFYILTDRIEDEEVLRTMLRLIRGTIESRAREELGIEGVTLSMGVSTYPEDGKTYAELLDIADKSLYIAKEKGKNRYIIYRPAMHENVNVGANRRGISSYDEQAKVINRAVRDMFVKGKEAIEESIASIVKGFDLDSIDIFYGPEMEKVFSGGKYLSDLDAHVFLGNKRFTDEFDETGLHVLNHYQTLRRTNAAIFDYLNEKKCMSMIQLALPSVEAPKFFVSYNLLNRNHKWSDAEISNLTLFATLVYELLERENNA